MPSALSALTSPASAAPETRAGPVRRHRPDAQGLNVSRATLSRRFSAAIGQSPAVTGSRAATNDRLPAVNQDR
ncbi:hypothetical protein L083_2933 [Actinoplanes sp. N902-109]|nr:hypothetical protein L083_2933 [Actinoplanes sp. N902-109]